MSLLGLPQELLLRVSSHLTTRELGCFRRTCKHVEASLFDSFAKGFFTKRQFMIEHVSLQALVDIANHPTLSQRLSEVIISLHMFDELSAAESDEHGHINRALLLESGLARDMLVDAFSKLPNLRTVGLRDYNARGRDRDGEGLMGMWRSYGWSYGIKRDDHGHAQWLPSVQSMTTEMRLASPETTFGLILYALGCAGARPDSIEVFLRRRKLTTTSLSILNGPMAAKVMPVLAGLKTLMLIVTLEYTKYSRQFGAPWLAYDGDNATVAPMQRLLHRVPDLETLRLNFDYKQFFAPRFLDWLGKPVPTSPPPGSSIPPVSLAKLTSLDLGQLNVTSPTLLSVITNFTGLQSLSLWKITLQCKNTEDFKDKPDRWARFLEDLSDALSVSTQLDSVLIGWAYQARYPSSHVSESAPIRFRLGDADVTTNFNPGRHDHTIVTEKVTYHASRGPTTMADWLRDMSGRTTCLVADDDSSDTEADSDYQSIEALDESEPEDDEEDDDDDRTDDMEA